MAMVWEAIARLRGYKSIINDGDLVIYHDELCIHFYSWKQAAKHSKGK